MKFTAETLDDFQFWQKSGNKIVLKHVRQLLQAIAVDSFAGIGKFKALKHHLSGFWSRQIN